MASVDTGNDRRDSHLQSEDLFDAERFPYITFESIRVRRVGTDAFEIEATSPSGT